MSVTIQITGDVTFEKEITAFQAAHIIGFLSTSEVTNTTPNVGTVQPVLMATPQGRVSLREIISQSDATTNPQKITVIGHHLIEREGRETFTTTEVRLAFPRAGERPPRNFSRDVRDAVRAGYIAEDEQDKENYFITNTGLGYLRDGFPATDKKSSSATKRKRSNGSNGSKTEVGSKIRPEIKALTMDSELDGYPLYHSLNKKADKLLWLLVFADDAGIKTLHGQEIEYLASQLRDNVANKQVASLTSNSLKKGLVKKNLDGYTILQKGIDYVKGLQPSTQ